MRPAMGSVGDAYDNAMCESFFATLKCKLLERHRFRNPNQARRAVFDFIEGFYNRQRRHSAMNHRCTMSNNRQRRSNVRIAVVPYGFTAALRGPRYPAERILAQHPQKEYENEDRASPHD